MNDTKFNNTQPNPSKRLWFGLPFKVLLLIGAVVMFTGIAYWLSNHKDNRINVNTKHTYSQLEAYKLDSGEPGSSMTFQKPVEFNKLSNQKVGVSKVQLDHTIVSDNKTVLIGGAKASLTSTLSQNSAASTIRDISSPSPVRIAQTMKIYTADRVGNKYKIKSYNMGFFTNPVIKSNAWQADFDATPMDTQSSQLPIKGKVIVAIGDKTYYYFLLFSIEKNWSLNQSVWQQVFDSLKIDQ